MNSTVNLERSMPAEQPRVWSVWGQQGASVAGVECTGGGWREDRKMAVRRPFRALQTMAMPLPFTLCPWRGTGSLWLLSRDRFQEPQMEAGSHLEDWPSIRVR